MALKRLRGVVRLCLRAGVEEISILRLHSSKKVKEYVLVIPDLEKVVTATRYKSPLLSRSRV